MKQHIVEAIQSHLQRLYTDGEAEAAHARLVRSLERFESDHPHLAIAPSELFNEADVWIIAYGDHVTEPNRAPLATLEEFLGIRLGDVVGGVHLLPHFPATSDGGFAVVDYQQVNARLGDWDDVTRLGARFRLMLDAVVNHTSASSSWFQSWLNDDPAYSDFYITSSPCADLDKVVRPRTTPLLTSFDALQGKRHVWTTFGPDQVDLNYANPAVLLRVTDVLLSYVARGASALRLDAIPFLWKQPGTSCIHLPQTHEIIRLWRTVMDAVAPGTLLVTETNVPHEENLSYFGNGTNEAHLVYQFPLPPLVLHAFRRGDTSVLVDWLSTLDKPATATSFLNFLSSHDGIGLRPVEELIPASEIAELVEAIETEGGGVTYRAVDGRETLPYELNVSYFDALTPPESPEPLAAQATRFLAAQSLLLALAGVPAIYLHSLLGSRNWLAGPQASGHSRDINREKLDRAETEAALDDPPSLRALVFTGMRARIKARIVEPAFHPTADQRIVSAGPGLVAFERGACGGQRTLFCAHNLTDRPQHLRATPAEGLTLSGHLVELCTGDEVVVDASGTLELDLEPYAVRWLGKAT